MQSVYPVVAACSFLAGYTLALGRTMGDVTHDILRAQANFALSQDAAYSDLVPAWKSEWETRRVERDPTDANAITPDELRSARQEIEARVAERQRVLDRLPAADRQAYAEIEQWLTNTGNITGSAASAALQRMLLASLFPRESYAASLRPGSQVQQHPPLIRKSFRLAA